MDDARFPDVLGPALTQALEERGFSSLTAVQLAVLDPASEGRDLRISSQTGSGKTVAIGLVLRAIAAQGSHPSGPRALVIAPTRELARQVEEELTWFLAPLGARVASLTGGASYRDEHRALAARTPVIVGTPGRILDHVERATLDLSGIGAVVLDEADRMLDLGFREALESILDRTPPGRRTHLVSATFAFDVLRLADRVQRQPMHIEGTRLGAANVDIEHVLHMVHPDQRFEAVVNLLLAHDARTLIFANTRAAVGQITEDLADAGFQVAPLSGEMAQRERTRALEAFRRGTISALVATDVAARGLDVQDIGLVLHVDPPTDPDAYTHRSGRTGRAGRKGTSALLVTPRELPGVRRVLGRAGLRARTASIPDAESIRASIDARVVARLSDESTPLDPRLVSLAERVLAEGEPVRAIARLLAASPVASGPEPRDVRPVAPPREAPPSMGPRGPRAAPPWENRPAPRNERFAPPGRESRFGAGAPEHRSAPPPPQDFERDSAPAMAFEGHAAPAFRDGRDTFAPRPGRSHDAPPSGGWAPDTGAWTVFQVSWGERHGADPRRLLAMICRRGGIERQSVGSIRVGQASSHVEIAPAVADTFLEAMGRPDPRDPRIKVRPAAR